MDANVPVALVGRAGQIIAAVGALGTAAYGLVDTSKTFWGGPSNFGFKYIKNAMTPFRAALEQADGTEWTRIMRANWINGVSKDDQKAKAKGLIRLGLTKCNAGSLAAAGKVDATALIAIIGKLEAGTPLIEPELNLLGRFDAMIDVTLDGAFERADQVYRNGSKACAAVVALALSVGGEWAIRGGAFDARQFFLALLVGAIAVPLAPVAKDLSSSLVAAVKALKSTGG